MPALARISQATAIKLHRKISNALITCQRTGLTSVALIDVLKRDEFRQNMYMITPVTVLATEDFVEGDFFYAVRMENPGVQSSLREIKFIQTLEEGYSIKELTVIGTIDL